MMKVITNNNNYARMYRLFLYSLFFLILSGSGSYASQEAEMVVATVINFSEYESGSGQYPVTMMVTEDFLRIDDTAEGKDYILYKRKEKKIFSVNAENQQTIQIQLIPVSIPAPLELNIRTEKLAMDDNAPLISGKKPQHHQFYVNEQLCYDLISVPGLMPDALEALKEFKQVLAGQQAETLRYIPGDLHDACDLTRHIFYPHLYLSKGFPIFEKATMPRETKSQETLPQEPMSKKPMSKKTMSSEQSTVKDMNILYSRVLQNFMQKEVKKERFVLPDFEIIPIN